MSGPKGSGPAHFNNGPILIASNTFFSGFIFTYQNKCLNKQKTKNVFLSNKKVIYQVISQIMAGERE